MSTKKCLPGGRISNTNLLGKVARSWVKETENICDSGLAVSAGKQTNNNNKKAGNVKPWSQLPWNHHSSRQLLSTE
jgi:hypothetical protein